MIAKLNSIPTQPREGDSCQPAGGGERGVKYREITIIMFFLSTQAQYPADSITKIPVFIAQELANRGIEGIYLDIKGVFLRANI